MPDVDPTCLICSQAVTAGVPVIFNHGDTVHLDCYVGAEGPASVVENFCHRRPKERFCYACLARLLAQERREVEKAAIGLRLTKRVVIEPLPCSICTHPRVTIRLRQAGEGGARPA